MTLGKGGVHKDIKITVGWPCHSDACGGLPKQSLDRRILVELSDEGL